MCLCLVSNTVSVEWMKESPNTRVIQVVIREEGVLVLFADGSYSVYPEALLYGSRQLALTMSGLEERTLASLIPALKD